MSLTVTFLGTGSPMPSPDRAGPATLPLIGVGGTENEWRALAAASFDGSIELGDDLHTVIVNPRT